LQENSKTLLLTIPLSFRQIFGHARNQGGRAGNVTSLLIHLKEKVYTYMMHFSPTSVDTGKLLESG